jgi:hypothetical protein
MKIKHSLRKIKGSHNKIITIQNHQEICNAMVGKLAWLDFLAIFKQQIEKALGTDCYYDYATIEQNYGKGTEFFERAMEEDESLHNSITYEQNFIMNAVIKILGSNCSISGEIIYGVLNELHRILKAIYISTSYDQPLTNEENINE